MAQYGKIGFDFDHWARLARTDPETFEQKRSELINEFIEKAPEHMKRRLNGLQWQVDTVRQGSSNPMAACLKISRMMWDSVLEEDGLLDSLNKLSHPELEQSSVEKPAAMLHSIKPSNRTRDD